MLQSYNSTAQRTITVSSAQSKTYVFNHEFYQLFRIIETHVGTIFDPMPSVTFTSTITTANSTTIAGTFSTQNTDDYVELSTRYWVKNGTQTAGAISWRGLEVRPSGDTCSVTSYGTCDFEVYSKHYGISASKHHFRMGVDGLTTDIDNISYDSSTAVLTFNGTASGTKTIKVEFLSQNFDGVANIEIDDTLIAGSRFTIDTIDSLTKVLTITGTSFSEKKIEVFFTVASSSGGSGAGGGGGGGGSGGSISPPPFGRLGTSPGFNLIVTMPVYTVPPGSSQTQEIIIQGQGTTKYVISSITFLENPEWFTLGQQPPISFVVQPGGPTQIEIPLTVTVPPDVRGVEKTIPVRIIAASGSGTATVDVPVNIVLAATPEIALYGAAGMLVAIVAGVAYRGLKKRR